MKRYYELPKLVQWIIAIILITTGFKIVLPLLQNSFGLLFFPFLTPIINFSSVPLFKLMGYYKYLNPYVISTVQTDKKYDLHNITTFDYFVNFKWSDRGSYVQKTMLHHYFKALITIINRIENNELSPDVKIVGNSYFFNKRTAERLGFKISRASLFWTLNSIIQFFELSYLYSFSKGKLQIPKFWNVKRAEIIGRELVTKKDILEELVRKTDPNITQRKKLKAIT
ncbi:hypothetical protein [Flammeovirga sp. SJP92]|uniref:hypothetical protein n=1 Tax=Flammeovirga sp. SJP92 TaxID=1775430 RepID=UPI000787AE3F|nr:hypothetical protein [Flammeovirga sp. SJP92]KXX69408.1 hypothetical protein AVL50_19195 [Flammeovirga sp. SJP92]